MKIALLGYGKMGKEIEAIAISRGHQIGLKITSGNAAELTPENLKTCQVAIEFSRPEHAISNMLTCFMAGVPVVVGTTGWYEHFQSIEAECNQYQASMLHASNFSIGVNLFFAINKQLAELMKPHAAYTPCIEEIHHTQKLDSPSGTAITLADGILSRLSAYSRWVNHEAEKPEELPIISHRIDDVPGTHTVSYVSDIDTLELRHTAHNRKGFAFGAVLAAEWLPGKKGIFTMNHVLSV